jgi:phenylalanyl-tRNA synthetase beta chain
MLGLLQALARNLARGQADLGLFEIGQTFHPSAGPLPIERRRVAGIFAGSADGWLGTEREVDFFDCRGAVEALAAALGRKVEIVPSRLTWLHPGVQAEVRRLGDGARSVGWLGEIDPRLGRALGLPARAFGFELNLHELGMAERPRFVELDRFPRVTRDLSFFIVDTVPAAEIRRAIEAVRDPLCVEVRVLEDYREPGRVPPGKKGMLWSFVYRAPDRTLTDAEVKSLHERLVARLAGSLSLELR